jgi:sugar-specific transcriptional regulator TrmB
MNNNSNEILHCLLDLGFSDREARVYQALLTRQNATASELQKLSGVPQSKIYEVLSGLARRGYTSERKSGRNRTYELVNPEVTLGASFNSLQERLKRSITFKRKLINLYQSSEKTTGPLDDIEILHGNDNIHNRYLQLVKATQEELLGFGRRPYACDTREKSDEQNREAERILKRGVISRWVYKVVMPDDEWIIKNLRNFQLIGEAVRIADTLPLKMMIFDHETLLIAEEEPFDGSGELTMSVIKQRTIVNAFCALFEHFWQNSIELDVWEKMQLSISAQNMRGNRR